MTMPMRTLPATIMSLASRSERARATTRTSRAFSNPLDELAAFLRAGVINDHRADVADVGVDRVAQGKQLDDRHEQREEERLRIAEDMQQLFLRDRVGAEP
jgi:hypothetical protein